MFLSFINLDFMKKISFILFLSILLANVISAQSKTDSTGSRVIQYLRDLKADSIYLLTGPAFRNKISLEEFKNITEKQLFPLNDFKNTSFVKMTNGINKYKISGTPELQLLVGLDEGNKIQTLIIQPYKED